MKKRILIPIILLIIGFISSCGKQECQEKSLNSLLCDNGYNRVNVQIYFINNYIEHTDYKVIDSIRYDSIFNNSKPFGTLDFNTQFIIGLSRSTNPGDGITKKAVICENVSDQKLKLKVAYSLSGQCRGSEINNFRVNAWAVLPIKYKNYAIEYDVIDINPFP